MMVRAALPGDENALIDLIQGLATFENEPDAVENTPERLRRDLFEFGHCEALVVEVDSKIIAFALFYTSYSTWKGPCLYLEDLYVLTEHRRAGIGDILFDRLVAICKERKYTRMDWQVLDWNEPAIKFYNKKNATLDPEWINGRLFFKFD
ncbi:MAG: GNAT family N-acetyltransferase [Crocinitomicaceae bacterium]|nr:GNAT family N-acetyltransferase [Crocinitomicaceae bacterium]